MKGLLQGVQSVLHQTRDIEAPRGWPLVDSHSHHTAEGTGKDCVSGAK